MLPGRAGLSVGSRIVRRPLAMSTALPRLSPAEVERYRAEGQVFPGWRLPPRDLERGRDALLRLLADNPTVAPELLVNSHIAKGGAASAFLDLASSPALVNLVAQCLGTENVILWACQVRGRGRLATRLSW